MINEAKILVYNYYRPIFGYDQNSYLALELGGIRKMLYDRDEE